MSIKKTHTVKLSLTLKPAPPLSLTLNPADRLRGPGPRDQVDLADGRRADAGPCRRMAAAGAASRRFQQGLFHDVDHHCPDLGFCGHVCVPVYALVGEPPPHQKDLQGPVLWVSFQGQACAGPDGEPHDQGLKGFGVGRVAKP